MTKPISPKPPSAVEQFLSDRTDRINFDRPWSGQYHRDAVENDKPDLLIQVDDNHHTIPDLDWTPEQLTVIKHLIKRGNGETNEQQKAKK